MQQDYELLILPVKEFAMISVKVKGDYKKATSYLEKLKNALKLGILDKYGAMGVDALQDATPKDTGLTAASWDYEINRTNNSVSIVWTNSNIQNGANIAVLIQYGHGTGWGSYVQGVDYINPALAPIFQQIADDSWKEITRL